ncbi:LysR family transcriptional regulator [Pseudomonas fluorescens]|uniref:LysR family transcriptional regulator n=1 Tax=Pseudomonas fluorescens TaxID=294 RepID=UPI00123F0B8C|nr:LysR family transcriptional regulator [Pseudomonas fluorescens]VVN43639.1 Nodulation protein D 2 [Pseudomonas fluorescens]
MNRGDLRRVDINILIVFETMMLERNLTRTAEKLFLSQPAISAALNRLRDYFDDPLFVRNGRDMEPTSRAQALALQLSPALDTMSAALSSSLEFNPSTSSATFQFGLSDDVEYGLLPQLMRELRAEAPNIVLIIRRVDYWQMPLLLTSGEISMGVSYTKDLPANSKRKFLRNLSPVLLRADNAESSIDLDEYCSRPHALVSYTGEISGFVDVALEKLGKKRSVILAIPQFSSLPALLTNTDLIATVPDYVAEAMVRQCRLGLRMEPLPFSTPDFELSIVWRNALDFDPAEQWLRERFHKCMRNVSK